MKRFYLVMAILLSCVALFPASSDARSLTGGRGVPVVSDPKDLSLVDMTPMSKYLYADLKNKGDFGLVRRVAIDIKAKQIGIPNPRKSPMHVGLVVNKGQSGFSSALLVVVGEFKFKDLRAAMDKDYQEYMQVNKATGSVSEGEVAGTRFTKYSYSERPYEACIVQLKEQKAIVVGSVPKGDYSILEETIKVVKGEEALSNAAPRDIDAQTTFKLTGREIERLVVFNRPKGKLRTKVAAGLKNLAQKLGIPQSHDETVPLEERIRGLLAQSDSMTAKYHWDRDQKNVSAYTVSYIVGMKNADQAEGLKELISEQLVRLSEKTTRDDERDSVGRLTVNTDGNAVNMAFILDSPEAQYQHLSLILSQGFRYRNVISFLDRHGQGAAAGQ